MFPYGTRVFVRPVSPQVRVQREPGSPVRVRLSVEPGPRVTVDTVSVRVEGPPEVLRLVAHHEVDLGVTNPPATADLATPAPQSCCGKAGDVGNSKGVGKYCTDPQGSECRANTGATVCSAIGNTTARKTYFCTTQCDPGTANYCGEGASCTYDSVNKAYGCTPDACTTNLPAGCTL